MPKSGRTRWLVILGILSACASTPVMTSRQSEECTLATPLIEGIPGSPGHLIASELNPNGASELATLMRRFVSDWQTARAQLKTSTPTPALLPTHRAIRCSWPTDSADRNLIFDEFAVLYLNAVRRFDEAPSASSYDNALSACQACHQASCGGPLELIESLRGL